MDEKRRDYPDILAAIQHIESQQIEMRKQLSAHRAETREITELWIHSRWLINSLRFIAALVAGIACAWIAIKQMNSS